jgi:sigma-54 dependent transcriptional regulator, flagellar regulatory protein
MSKNNKVLVLSEDDSRRRDLITILEFVGEEQVLAGDEALALLESDDEQTKESIGVAVINGEDAASTAHVQRVCKLAQGLPILLVGDPDLKGVSEDDANRIIARM